MDEHLAQIRERVALTERSADTAHKRIDQLEKMVKDDLKEMKADIKNEMKSMTDDMKIVLAFIERSKGMVALVTVAAGVLGWVISILMKIVFKT